MAMWFEALPDEVSASIEVRNAWRRSVADGGDGLEFLVSDIARWKPGSTVRVAFLDGDSTLHAKVAAATAQITDTCNLTLDFGVDAATGEHRRWTTSDADHAAEIRVSFDLGGYFSLVGTDSTDRSIGSSGDPVGGHPGSRSLNLGGFADHLPDDWQGTARHEFLHALAFHHSHQNMRGPCENEFRWEDDAGYQPTRDARGQFVADTAGRRPGIYTYLAGAPNRWPRAKVDHNLRTEDDPAAVAGPFDAASVMLYAFPPFFYKSTPSPCAPTGNGVDLSDGDHRGLRLLYPEFGPEAVALEKRATAVLEVIGVGAEAAVPESADGASAYRDRVIELVSGLAG
jgi:hypothetical protein